MKKDIQDLMVQFEADPLGLLKELDGYYLRPSPEAPLVGYAGMYEDSSGQEKHYVGDLYANFAMAEHWPTVVGLWAKQLAEQYMAVLDADVFLGAPEGGKSFADKLADHYCSRYVYPNVVEIPSQDGGRSQKTFKWGRHSLSPGQTVVIVEDVANNFSTTDKLLKLVTDAGCTPIGIACILNRSPHVDGIYKWSEGDDLPVFSRVRKPMPEYQQDDEYVAADVANGNIVWKPRESPETWQKLMDAMN